MEKFPAEINMEEFIRNLEDGLKVIILPVGPNFDL